eukprot:6103341-Pyramimonas_sp.AAC.1
MQPNFKQPVRFVRSSSPPLFGDTSARAQVRPTEHASSSSSPEPPRPSLPSRAQPDDDAEMGSARAIGLD